ncbi:MAG TPA: hypothetical protein VHS28_07650 [Chloroflexota bacterium]|nr:hypothetical protein [Chloroflexota bacterium]
MRRYVAPHPSGEMNVRRAHWVKAEIAAESPTDELEVWAIGQGLAFIRVRRMYGTQAMEWVLHNEREAGEFLDRVRQRKNREAEAFAADKARNGDDTFEIE